MRGFSAALAILALIGTVVVAGNASARRRPGCGSRCRNLGGIGGSNGACFENAGVSGSAAVADSRRLKISIDGPFPSQGDVMVAAIASRGHVSPPSGWTAVAGGGPPLPGGELQVFYRVAGDRVAESYTFTAPSAQRISGALLDVSGAAQKHPISVFSTQSNPSSRSVTAPSIGPLHRDSLLLFIARTSRGVKWTAPRGMKTILPDPFGPKQASRFSIATQRWHPAKATGTRTATISRAASSTAALLAVHYPEPITCPRVKVLSRHFQPNRHGILRVRMTCQWTARCRGAFEGVDLEDHFPTPKIAASDFSIRAGATRTVRIALTRRGFRALKRHHKLAFDIFVWVQNSAGQYVVAGSKRGKITAPAG